MEILIINVKSLCNFGSVCLFIHINVYVISRCLFIVVSCFYFWWQFNHLGMLLLWGVEGGGGGRCCARSVVRDTKVWTWPALPWKEKFPRGGEWKVTKNTYICSIHFSEIDFVTDTQDKKKNRNIDTWRKMHFLLFSPIALGSTSKPVPRTSTDSYAVWRTNYSFTARGKWKVGIAAFRLSTNDWIYKKSTEGGWWWAYLEDDGELTS